MRITRTKINGIENPLGFSFEKVIATWNVEKTISKALTEGLLEVSTSKDFKQIVYKKRSKSLDQTGEVIDIALLPCTRYYWRVTITGDKGDKATSDIQWFETGKMGEKWTGKWIAAPKGKNFHPVFSKKLDLKVKPAKARLYVSCLGVFEAYLDGQKIGNEILTPYINDYETGMQIITFDVTDQLKAGSDISIDVAKGWYMSNFGLEGGHNFGDRMAAIAELHVFYEDGTKEIIGTDKTWTVSKSDVSESGIYYGEDIDRTLGITSVGKACEIDTDKKLLDRYSIPVVVKEVLKPKEILHTKAGETVVDFGQNHAGVMELDVKLPKGTKIEIDCGEILQEGNFFNQNYRTARSRFVYISDGRKETVHPRFTFFGYRYLRIKGWPKNASFKAEMIRSNVIYSDMERTGFIKTSNSKINRLYENCIWGQKSNFVDMPTDCPQRDERLGWTGDAQVFSQTGSYNMDTRAFYRKFLRDLALDAKRHDGGVASFLPNTAGNLAGVGSVWSDVSTIIPETLFNTFGSLEDVKEHYEMMKGWVDYMRRNDKEHGDKGYFMLPFQFGDWLGLDGITEQSFKGGTNDDYLASVYYFRSTMITARIAQLIGQKDDAKTYKALAGKIRKAILHEYFTPSGRLSCDTQAAYIVALAFDIYVDRDKLIDQFIDRLKKDCYQIKCGFVGAPLLCITLGKIGRMDLAYHFLFNEGFPGWLYCVNLGATTIWERWNSVMPDGSICKEGMNSLNHYSYGTVVQFMYEYIGGIRPAEPGFKEAIIAPNPSMKFRFFNTSMTTAAGRYVSDWKIAKDGTFTLKLEVPFNAKAQVSLPRFSKEGLAVSGLKKSDIKKDGTAYLEAGSYEISYMPSSDYRCVYGPDTRLSELASDKKIMKLLEKELPKVYGMISSGDKENGNLTLGQLPHLFYLGIDPKAAKPVLDKIFSMVVW